MQASPRFHVPGQCMNKRLITSAYVKALLAVLASAILLLVISPQVRHFYKIRQGFSIMTTSTIGTDVNNFILGQNPDRGGAVAGGGLVPLYYDALTGTVPSGSNSVTGISGIAAGAAN